ncbi:MAG: hypothetical protein FWC73_08500 [Defluviitaleaceae bacterium]|nr:hypothetical protein [Defluviitaleaceae bacterium]
MNTLSFTRQSKEAFDAIDLEKFQDNDSEAIYDFILSKIKLIPFGDYLKRHVYVKANMTGDFLEIDIKDYQRFIINSFAENSTPKSFTETTAKMSALTKNWLTQASVIRSVVFLLGFGLNMNVDDVSEFLTKALRERDFNFKDPAEIIYWYCYKNGYNFPKMESLKRQYNELEPLSDFAFNENRTRGIRDTIISVKDDETLMRYLSSFKKENDAPMHSVSAWQWFSDLYQQCKIFIADDYNADEAELPVIDSIYEGVQRKMWTPDDIDEGIVEKVLCCGTPVNNSGNLQKQSASKLARYFSNKRLSRQHLASLLSRSVAVDRFDLMTLNFFIFSQSKAYGDDNKSRYNAFMENTNTMLTDCMMGELYITNPYECFLLLCLLSDCPLATYADVWEFSFDE